MIQPPPPSGARYRQSRRRLLIDMHIPDWDPAFLSRFDPAELAAATIRTGADAAMLYFQNHVGLCFYPTTVGQRHRAAAQRDLAGEALTALRAGGLATCAYYSVNFNNQVWQDHPDWRLAPAAPASVGVLPRERYGIVCLNHPAYRAFADAQIDEILAYPVDAMFFDMVWWNGVCTCPSCEARYRQETGAEIPATVDWNDPDWCRFQARREAWLAQFARDLRGRVKAARPEMEVYHNFALGLSNWTRGVSLDSIDGHDFLGGDFHGGTREQLLINRLLRAATPLRPAEYMSTVGTDLTQHTRLHPAATLRRKALAALSADNAFLAILAIDPDGRIDPLAVERTHDAFAALLEHDPGELGEAIEPVALYCSDRSKASRWDAPRPIGQAPASSLADYPHSAALLGAARALQRAHIPFGVATRRALDQLARWPVLILPNVETLEADEQEAIRAYVQGGGRLYASRSTSLDSTGRFGLGDLFGCTALGDEEGAMLYAESDALPELRRPLTQVCAADRRTGALRIAASPGAEILASRTLPYAYPARGTAQDRQWSTIHASPPWQRTADPVILRHQAGRGLAIYSAFDIEAGETPEHEAAFIALIRQLAPDPELSADAHPDVWFSGFARPGRITLMFLHMAASNPALTVPQTRVRVKLPDGSRCQAIRLRSGGAALPFGTDGRDVHFDLPPFTEMMIAEIDHD